MIRAIIASTLVLGLAGLAATLAWRASAAVRHTIWLIGLTTALGVGALAAGPRIEVESSLVNGPGVVAFPAEFRELASGSGLRAADFASPTLAAAPPAHFSLPPASTIVTALWLVVAILIVGRALLGRLAAARVIRRSRHLDVDRRLEVDANIDVRVSADVDAPFTLGARRPVILLPAEAEAWDDERLRIVLVHEAAHVARHDYVTQMIATVACAAYWFNPITWLAASRLRAEAEHAADDRVLAAGVDGVTYASHLLELARPESGALSTAMAVPMARGNRLERRFTAMLDSTRSRGIVPLRLQAAVGSAALLAAVPFTALRLVAPAPKAGPAFFTAPAVVAAPTPTAAASASAIRQSANGSTRAEADTIIEKTLAAASGESISITLRTGGSVTVHAWNQPQVRVRGVLSGTQARETQVLFERVGRGLELRTVTEERRNYNGNNRNSFELWVPRKFDIAVSSGGGGITITGVEGRFTGNTGGGEIVLDNVSGVAELTTGGGEVQVTNSSLEGRVSTGGGEAIVTNTTGGVRVSSGSGPVIRDGGSGTRVYGMGGLSTTSSSVGQYGGGAKSTSYGANGAVSMTWAGGDIRLENAPAGGSFTTGGGEIAIGAVGGRATFTTGGGDIRIGNVADDIVATTGAGSVEISVVEGNGTARNITVTSGSGRIVIDLPANIDARFELESGYTERNGKTQIRSDFPVNVTETEEWDSRNGTPRRYVRATGTSGSGRGLIRIHTMNGDVIIRRR